MFNGGRGATQGRRSAHGTGRSASWPGAAPTSAGGRKAQACGASCRTPSSPSPKPRRPSGRCSSRPCSGAAYPAACTSLTVPTTVPVRLAVVCARLGVHLIHARPYQPAGKGKIERFFRTVRAQFLARLEEADERSLATLNAMWGAWLDGEYHQSPHRGLDGRTPPDQWVLMAENLRRAAPDLDPDGLFRFRYKRRVNQDRTVSLHTVLYEVDAALVGEKVTLLQDPATPPEGALDMLHKGQAAGQATLLDAYANTRARRSGVAPPPAAPAPSATATLPCATWPRGGRTDVPAALRPDPLSL